MRLMSLAWQVPGVSRVALITGLDRTGVEVACAIRPRGHVLQVCNGKGLTPDTARRGALLEAAELAAAESVPSPLNLVWATREALLGACESGGDQVWSLQDCESAGALRVPSLSHDGIWMAWCRGVELHTGDPLWVPAQAIHCPPPGARSLGPLALEWTTNGMGAHPSPERALLHALLEATERSELARALPDGWTRAVVQRRRLEWTAHPRAAAIEARLRARGFHAHLFDAAPGAGDGLGLPVRAALLVDSEGGPVPLTAGYACRLDHDEAAVAALLEAAQSRLTEIHGAREEVAHEAADVTPLLKWLKAGKAGPRSRSRPLSRRSASARAPANVTVRKKGFPSPGSTSRSATALPANLRALWRKGTRNAEVKQVLQALRAGGYGRAAAVILPTPTVPAVTVVKVIVPGFGRSELLG